MLLFGAVNLTSVKLQQNSFYNKIKASSYGDFVLKRLLRTMFTNQNLVYYQVVFMYSQGIFLGVIIHHINIVRVNPKINTYRIEENYTKYTLKYKIYPSTVIHYCIEMIICCSEAVTASFISIFKYSVFYTVSCRLTQMTERTSQQINTCLSQIIVLSGGSVYK